MLSPLFFPVGGQGAGSWEDEQAHGLQKNSLVRAIQVFSSLLLKSQFAISLCYRSLKVE